MNSPNFLEPAQFHFYQVKDVQMRSKESLEGLKEVKTRLESC